MWAEAMTNAERFTINKKNGSLSVPKKMSTRRMTLMHITADTQNEMTFYPTINSDAVEKIL